MVKRLINSCTKLSGCTREPNVFLGSSHTRLRLWVVSFFTTVTFQKCGTGGRENIDSDNARLPKCSFQVKVHVVTANEYLQNVTRLRWVSCTMAWFVMGINQAAKSPMEKKKPTSVILLTNELRDWFWLPSWHGCTCKHGSTSTNSCLGRWGWLYLDRRSQLYHMADHFVKSLDKDDYIIDIQFKTIGLIWFCSIDKAEEYFKLDNPMISKCSS